MDKKVLFVGLVCIDIIAETESFPVEDTDQRVPELCRRRGGNASNSSSVTAQLGLHTEFLGTLGQCTELASIKEDFAAHSVFIENCPVLQGQEFSTSVVIINQQNGTRTILHHPKRLPELHPNFMKRLDLSEYSWIHFEGRSENVDHIKEMISFIRQSVHAIKISVEIEKSRPILKELIPLGDVLFVSKDFSVFSGYHSMKKAVEGFSSLVQPGTIVVCPWGAEGAAAGRNGKIHAQCAIPPDQIVETLGAGDTLNAAFIYSQIKGLSLEKSLRLSCRVAGWKVGQRGFRGIEKSKDTLVSDLLNDTTADER